MKKVQHEPILLYQEGQLIGWGSSDVKNLLKSANEAVINDEVKKRIPIDSDGKNPLRFSATLTSCPPFSPKLKSKNIDRNFETGSGISRSDFIQEANAPRTKKRIIKSKFTK